MKPLSTVDDPNFVKMFSDLSENLHVMSRRTLGRKIEMSQKELTEKLINILSNLDYVSTTADIWSTKTRSFLGVTAHWIDKNTLKRMSCVLSFDRFKGSHTYDKIAEMLFEIQSLFKLKLEQVVSTTTDNGSNFVKAFREFGVTNYIPDFSDGDADLADTAEVVRTSSSIASDILYDEVLLPHNSIEEITTRELYLPRHLRCASHTLSLLATTDMNNYIKESPISRVHYSAIAKCTLLWNMSRRPKSAEIIQECLGNQLVYPCPTRWNSLYDSIVQLMKTKSKLNDLFDKLGKTNAFSAIELEYLEEFVEVLKPIATALDYIQGNNCYYGKLLPSLMSVRTRLERLQGNNLRHFSGVVSKLKDSLEKRFDNFFKLSPEVNEAILASCYHPAYKMRWLPESTTSEEKQRIQNLAIYALEANFKKHEEGSRRSSNTSKEDDDFIIFINSDSDRPQTSKWN
ncbi:uncharacterized protein LOC113236922 [Hyposmocoma kahamanoa]|uniref:uncharacterized protein LOC113236922 n=1 Tax=Hyposmocoma kahamanoa TaxID=1477025 RepID=UPI000E6D8B7D|nr:uncharacterized protein LOC113236922 [Hyposmocoma kahamanoa]